RQFNRFLRRREAGRKKAAERSQQKRHDQMNQNRDKQRPENCARVLFIIPQPVGLGENSVSCRHGTMIAWSKSIGPRSSFKAGTVSQGTGADNLGGIWLGSACRACRASAKVCLLAIMDFFCGRTLPLLAPLSLATRA